MSSKQARFVGTIPETYERVLGPFLFDYYARDLAARLAAPAGGRVLEIACGTGISTEAARAALDQSVHITATDLNPPMLELARAKRGICRASISAKRTLRSCLIWTRHSKRCSASSA